MNSPIIHIEDNFFDDFYSVKKQICSLTFEDHTSDIDKVTYPQIAKSIPDAVRYEFLYKLENTIGARVAVGTLFARAMMEGVLAPNAIHSDRDMGAYTAHVYIGAPKSSETTFYSHKEWGLWPPAHVSSEHFDSKDFNQFHKVCSVKARKNRLLVHHASPFHCAHPVEGSGKTIDTARLVLTCFFNVK